MLLFRRKNYDFEVFYVNPWRYIFKNNMTKETKKLYFKLWFLYMNIENHCNIWVDSTFRIFGVQFRLRKFISINEKRD